MMTLATLVIAGDADSTGNGSSGAFGNGSGSGTGTVAAAVAGPAERRELPLSTTGFGGGEAEIDSGRAAGSMLDFARGSMLDFAKGSTLDFAASSTLDFAVSCFGFRGLSHFSQRIPRVIAAPHMKHLEAIGRAILRPLLVLLQRDSLRARSEGT
jgi:hypothetical protein